MREQMSLPPSGTTAHAWQRRLRNCRNCMCEPRSGLRTLCRRYQMRLEGKVAIVTGGAHGMGEADVRLFAREGAKIVIADILVDQGESLASSLRDAGHDVSFRAVDVTSDADWEALMTSTLSKHKQLDVLVNNAGISAGAVQEIDEIEGWHKLRSVNATSVFLGSR